MLALATIGFGVNFWAWALLSPLAPLYKEELGLTSFQQALVVAVPVIVGVGQINDRPSTGEDGLVSIGLMAAAAQAADRDAGGGFISC